MRFLILILCFTLSGTPSLAQWVTTVSTSKPSYGYGESIRVQLRLQNTSSVPETLFSSNTCIAMIRPDDVTYSIPCGFMEVSLAFSPGMTRTWVWHIVPENFGYPTFSGKHRVLCYTSVGDDSAKFDAPMYLGGLLTTKFSPVLTQVMIDSLRVFFNSVATYHRHDATGTTETWRESGFALDSLVALLSADPRVLYSIASRTLSPDSLLIDGISGFQFQPVSYGLRQNYPNPFNPSTVVAYTLGSPIRVHLAVYNILGQCVDVLVDEVQDSGEYSVVFDGTHLSSGVYICRLTTSEYSSSKQMLLVK
jgi:hypothetical protein